MEILSHKYVKYNDTRSILFCLHFRKYSVQFRKKKFLNSTA